MNKKSLINFSSHALSAKTLEILNTEFDTIEDIFINNVDFNKSVETQFSEMLVNIKTKLDGSVSITIIVPGQATIAVLLIIYLSGIIGHIPNICLLEMDENGFFIPTNNFILSGNKLKSEGRKFRQDLWNKKA